MDHRRSSSLNTHDSNGRDYLASLMCWSRYRLEKWITSPTVRPHLQLWYQTCITSERRFNDAVEWINTGPRGYFYNEHDLEEDLLLMCLCKGHAENIGLEESTYEDARAETGKWITQELWARTVWRIVQASRGKGQAFEMMGQQHPAACYGFVIDLLCMAFHSIAFRGKASCYEWLVNGPVSHETPINMPNAVSAEADEDQDADPATTISTVSSSTEMNDDSADLDFEEASSRTSPASRGVVRAKTKVDDSGIRAQSVRKWITSQMTIGREAEDGGG